MTRFPLLRTAVLSGLFTFGGHCVAQISLQSAVNLALKNSPRIRLAQADLDKARAARSEARDAYIPTVGVVTGYGQSTGAPLNVPVVFSISAQSLVFSFSQKDYIRSADQAVQAAELILHNNQVEVVEDTTNTYLALDYALERKSVLHESIAYADRLVSVTTDRISLGVDAKVELPKSRRTGTQLRLASLQTDDDIAANRQHLAQLTGLPATALVTDRNSVPAFTRSPANEEVDMDKLPDSDGIKAAFANARAKQYVAFGDSRYLLRPQIILAANYSRVATSLSSYLDYYPRYGGAPGFPNSENALSFGLQFNFPLLDMAHRAKARGSAADAARAYAEADQQRGVYREGRSKLLNSSRELDLRAQLARDDREIAQDQLETLQIQMQQEGGSQGAQVTPKDQLNAQLQERQKYLDVLAADLQLRQTQVNLLRQTDRLGNWLLTTPGSRTVTPTVAPAAGIPVPTPLGTSPGVLPQSPTVTPHP
ncbi:TolC family protein [Terriglobus roseus]|uniref:Outer membrane protein TolC n=1 Tax=Terriglobus roseus TaxID=392734 RepID=A0A1H4ISD1_9BACT|nr:TolC family protein [Terriglobus roseus]SEB36970.1 Outer membrane protein TolC [Terriglobus roseus]